MSTSEQLEKGRRVLQQLNGGHADDRGGVVGQVFPDFWEMQLGHLFGEVYSRPGLALKERIMVNLTGLIFHKFDFGIANCMRWALNNGISREEILEIIMHVAHYGGWPCGVNAIHVAKDILPPSSKSDELDMGASEETDLKTSNWLEKGRRIIEQISGANADIRGGVVDQVFPEFREMSEKHLFGEVFSRPGLALRERIMVNLTCLIFHKYNFGIANGMRWALNIGISREEILEIIMHVAHYGGWPCGVNAIHVAKDVFSSEE